MCLCQSTDFVIPTEAKPSGGIWLRTKSEFGRTPDASTESTLSEVERARHDKSRGVGFAPPLLASEMRSPSKTVLNKSTNRKTLN